jgi:pimeloyl-ACP methyl ester carboxylesterase
MLPTSTPEDSARTSRNAYSNLFALCASDADCQKRYSDLEKRYVSAMRALKKRPAEIDGLRLSASDLSEIVYSQLYETEDLKMIPRTIDLAFRREYRGLAGYVQWAALNQRFRERGRQIGTASGPVYLSVLCRDNPATKKTRSDYVTGPWPKDIESLSRYEAWNLKRQCALWPTRKRSIEFLPLTHPSLFITGALDPITPAGRKAKDSAKIFNIDFPRRSHGILLAPTECAFGIIQQFIDDPSKKPDDRCVAAVPLIKFD